MLIGWLARCSVDQKELLLSFDLVGAVHAVYITWVVIRKGNIVLPLLFIFLTN